MQATQTARPTDHPRSAEYRDGAAGKNQIPMCSLQPWTCSQVKVLPRQWMVGPSSDSRLRRGETLAGASSAVNGRACRRPQAAGGDWSAALANVQAATLRTDCRSESVSFSETSEKDLSEQPDRDRNGEGSLWPENGRFVRMSCLRRVTELQEFGFWRARLLTWRCAMGHEELLFALIHCRRHSPSPGGRRQPAKFAEFSRCSPTSGARWRAVAERMNDE